MATFEETRWLDLLSTPKLRESAIGARSKMAVGTVDVAGVSQARVRVQNVLTRGHERRQIAAGQGGACDLSTRPPTTR